METSWVGRGAAGLAYAGGGVLLGMAGVTVTSIVCRALPALPLVPGDFELVEMGAAIAVFLFLPWCQISRGQVTVDLVSARCGPRGHAVLGVLGQVALLCVSAVVLWRLWLGFGEKFPFGTETLRQGLALGDRPYFTETTYDLMIPVWIPFAACLPGAAWWVVCCAASIWQSAAWLRDGAEP